MDVIAKRTEKFIEYNLGENSGNIIHQHLLKEVDSQLDNIATTLDKIRFINAILEVNDIKRKQHLKDCKNPTCEQDYEHAEVVYSLNNMLIDFGVKIDKDAFTIEEKLSSDEKIDKILKDLEELKMGHEIIYEDLLREITELKELYFLGKKKWHQLLLGKMTEMIAGGILSETLSKQIVENLHQELPKLLNEIIR